MGQIADALKKLQENPDDLTTLPNLISKVEQVEGQDEYYQERIQKLQQINRDYLAQIPIPGQEQEEEQKDEEPTLEDAQQHIISTLGGNE